MSYISLRPIILIENTWKKALNAGKNIFVEKSITLNSSELAEMTLLADRKELIIGEAMTIWHMPLYRKLRQIISDGELGKVQIITVNFGSYKKYDMNNRFFNMSLAGGAMLDMQYDQHSHPEQFPIFHRYACRKYI